MSEADNGQQPNDPVTSARRRTALATELAQVESAQQAPPQQPGQPANAAVQPQPIQPSIAQVPSPNPVESVFQAQSNLSPYANVISADPAPKGISLTPQDLQGIQQGVTQAASGLDPAKIDTASRLVTAHQSAPDLAENLKRDAVATFIDPIVQHPLETLGLVAAGIGLGVLSGGVGFVGEAALGLDMAFLAVGAALAAPGMVASVKEEIQHPSDANLSRAIINTAAFGLAATPLRRAMPGLAASRDGFGAAMTAIRNADRPNQVGDALHAWGDLKPGAFQGELVDVLGWTPESFRQQMEQRGVASLAQQTKGGVTAWTVKTKNADIRTLHDRTEQLSTLWDQQRRLTQEMEAGVAPQGTEKKLLSLRNSINEGMQKMAPLRWRVGAATGMLSDTFGRHIHPTELSDVEQDWDEEAIHALQGHTRAMVDGTISSLGDLRMGDGITAAGAFEQLQAGREAGFTQRVEEQLKVGSDGRGGLEHLLDLVKAKELEIPDLELQVRRPPPPKTKAAAEPGVEGESPEESTTEQELDAEGEPVAAAAEAEAHTMTLREVLGLPEGELTSRQREDAAIDWARQAIEDPEIWAEAPAQVRLLARAFKSIANAKNETLIRTGARPQVQEAYVAHHLKSADPGDPATRALRETSALYESDRYDHQAAWQWEADFNQAQAAASGKRITLRQKMAEQVLRQKHTAQAQKINALLKDHGETIESLRTEHRKLQVSAKARATNLGRSPLLAREASKQARVDEHQRILSDLQEELGLLQKKRFRNEKQARADLKTLAADLDRLRKAKPPELDMFGVQSEIERLRQMVRPGGEPLGEEALQNLESGKTAFHPPNQQQAARVGAQLGKLESWGLDLGDARQRYEDFRDVSEFDREPRKQAWSKFVAAMEGIRAPHEGISQSAYQQQIDELAQRVPELEDALSGRKRREQLPPLIEKIQGQLQRAQESLTQGRLPKMRAGLAEAQQKLQGFEAELKSRLPGVDPELEHKLVTSSKREFNDMRREDRIKELLVTGREALHREVRDFAWAMESIHKRKFLEDRGNYRIKQLQEMYGSERPKRLGIMPLPQDWAKDEDVVLHGSIFRGQRLAEEEFARSRGYVQVMGAIGRPDDVGFRESLYMPEAIGNPLKAALARSSISSEFDNGFLRLAYKLAQGGRRAIMISPLFHLTNLVPRLLTVILSDPRYAIPALKETGGGKLFSQGLTSLLSGHADALMDPVEENKLSMRFFAAGGMKANRFNVGHMSRAFLEENTGEKHWGTWRVPGGQLADWHARHVETPFWTSVHHMQLFAFRYAEEALRNRVPEGELEFAAAQYANHVTGFVNPMYMNQVYKQLRGLVFFAPSYWGSFGQLMTSLMPFQLSKKIAEMGGGRYIRMSGAPAKFINDATRREWLRLQRSYSFSYLASAFVTADLFNMIGSGHHMWDNDPGHRYDIEVSKFMPDQKLGEQSKAAYINGLGWYRQAHDVANAIGLGHQWGLFGELNDDNFDKLTADQKAMHAAGGLLQGLWKQGLQTMGPVSTSAIEMGTGQSIQSIQDGVQVGLPPGGRAAIAANFLPAGNVALTALRMYQQAIADETSPERKAQLIANAERNLAMGALQSVTGIPSIHYLGIEQKAIGDDTLAEWRKTRTTLRGEIQNAANLVMTGHMGFYEYAQAKNQVLQRSIQSAQDTFGEQEPVTRTLAQKRARLAQDFHLDDITDRGTWMERYSAFLQAWDHEMESAGPQARAVWWDVERQNWTDVDYLEWMARQTKQALASSIDGQGGQHILGYERQIGPLLSQPLSAEQRASLEAGDPYYQQYRMMLRQVRRQSAMGAMLGAFTQPVENTRVLPSDMSVEQAQSLWGSQATILLPATIQALVARARALAGQPDVEQAGGEVAPEDVGLTQ